MSSKSKKITSGNSVKPNQPNAQKTPAMPKPSVAAANSSATKQETAEKSEPQFVSKRDQRRNSRQEMIQTQRAVRAQKIRRAKQQQLFGRAASIGAVVLVALLLGVWIYNYTHAPVIPTATKGNIQVGVMPAGGYGSAIQCMATEGTAMHYHANVQIYVNGKNEPIPAEVGIQSNCLYWLHTHNASGTVHIETPQTNGKYLLGDFIAVWAKNPANTIPAGPPDLTATQFFGLPINAQHPLKVYVNGQVYTGNPDNLVLYSGENIWLEYGTPLVTPVPYNFAANGVSP